MLRRFTLALCMSLAVAVSGQIAAAEDNAEPPVIRDEALADKQPVDPVKVEKMAAEVRQVFRLPKAVIAGCYVTEGKIERSARARLIRNS